MLFNSLFIESRMNTCRFFFRSFLGEVGSWSDLCFREIYSSIIFYWFIGSRDELFLICHQFLSYIHFIIFNTIGDLLHDICVLKSGIVLEDTYYVHTREKERDDTNFNFNFSLQFFPLKFYV